MNPEITSLVQACEWASSKFLIFSENVFVPLIYYSHLGAVVVTVLVSLFIFLKGRKELSNRLLFLTSIFFAIWVFGDLVLWATEYPSYTMFFWTLINLVEPFIYFFAFYFAYVFIYGKDFSLRQKISFSLPLLPTILLAPTTYMLLGFDLSNCDRAAHEGLLASYGYIVEIFYLLSILIASLWALEKNKDRVNKKKITLLTAGIIAFLLSFSLGNILEVFTENWYIGQLGLLGAPIFVGFLSYLIVRFRAFNIKLIATQALVAALILVTGSILFIRDIENVRGVLIPSLILVLIMSRFLVRSVKHEVEQRERLEKLSKELAVANDKLKELDKLKDEFLSFASHDLKSPVAKMKQWASLIYDKTYSTPAQIEDTTFKIQTTADRAIRLVDEFLNIRKIEEGRMEYNFESKDVVGFVAGITSDFQPIAKQKGLELTFSSASHALNTKIDTIKFRQVIENIIDNSLKYTDPSASSGQSPSTRLGASQGFVKVVITEEQQSILISVKDSGAGIAPEVISTLFAQFHRDPNVVKTIKGTGLGLYIAKQIILAHKGQIWAESKGLNQGSSFFVRIPKA